MKILKFIGILLLILCINFHPTFAKKELTKREKNVKAFTELEISGYFNVTLVQAKQHKVVVETTDDKHEFVDIKSKGKKLDISIKDDKTNFKNKIYLTVYFKELNTLITNGLIKLQTDESLSFQELGIETNGVIKANLEVEAKDFSIEVNGTGKVKLYGKAKNAEYIVNGAGSLEAYNLYSDNCEVEIAGAGVAKVFVNKELDVNLSGVSKLYYKGNPKDLNIKTSFLCNVKHVEIDEE